MISQDQLQRLFKEAIAHHNAKRFGKADAIYRQIRVACPRNFDALHLSGFLSLQQGRNPEAIELLGKALKIDPSSAQCALRLGLAMNGVGRRSEAEGLIRMSTRLDPKYAEAWDNLAFCLRVLDRLGEAVECHEKAVSIRPDSAAMWHNFGLTLNIFGRTEQALRCQERALAADPQFAKGHFGRAQALHQAHRIAEAVEAYDRYIEMEPLSTEARSFRLYALNNLEHIARERLFDEHVAFGRSVPVKSAPIFPNVVDPDRRLRVAILSPDLRVHSCSYFLEPILQHLDSERFEICLYHDHFREDSGSERLRKLAAVWRNFIGQPGDAVEKAIRADAPDVLFDLAGHTGLTNRLPLFARHLAPVQATYLGYPNTTGLPAIGYRFTDAIVDPLGEADRFATEKLVRLAPTAWTYQPPPDAPLPGSRPDSHGGVTFGCFNNLGKLTDSALTLWGRLLQAVPGSRLLLKGRGLSDGGIRGTMNSRLAACGLPSDRVDLVDHTNRTCDHLAQYHRVDVALDSFPYHGTTTTCEALWMGVPVVSLLGDRHAARVGASLLSAIGRSEWVAGSPDEYLRIAAGLAGDPVKLHEIKSRLRGEMQASPLLDHAGQAARFGDAIRSCWSEWCAKAAAGRIAA
jgi:protein O-GlcNAc transferase